MEIIKEHLVFWSQWDQIMKVIECENDNYFMIRPVPGSIMYDKITHQEFLEMKEELKLHLNHEN